MSSMMAGMKMGPNGQPDMASMMSDPKMMEMAQNMMKDPKMMEQMQGMMGGAGGPGGAAGGPNPANMMEEMKTNPVGYMIDNTEMFEGMVNMASGTDQFAQACG